MLVYMLLLLLILLISFSSFAVDIKNVNLECKSDGNYSGLFLEEDAVYVKNGKVTYWNNDTFRELISIGADVYAIAYADGEIFSVLFQKENEKIIGIVRSSSEVAEATIICEEMKD